MNNKIQSRIFSLTTGAVLLVGLLGLGACSNKKEGTPGGDTSNIGGQTAALQCGEGEFADASGKSKTGLKVQTSLYHALQDQATDATLLSGQDVYTKDGNIYYARSIPNGIEVTPGSGAAFKTPTLYPTLSMKFFEQGGQLMLAVGNYAGIDYYSVSTSALTPSAKNHFLGAVTDISAREGKLCVIADGGKAVVMTGPDASGGGACSQVMYQAGEHLAANGKAMEAQHVAAVPEGCLVVTRNIPKLQVRLMDMIDLLMSLINSSPQRIDLRGIEEKLTLLGNDGSSKDIAPTVGNYNKLVISDLDMFPEGAVATYTAFTKDNWDTFSSIDATTQPLRKIWTFLKLLAETRAGGLFVAGGEVKKNAELQGVPLTFNLNYPGGTVTINEFPHFSLPWFSEGAVDGNRYALKSILAFSIFDFSGLNDPNVASLPVEQYTWNNTPGNPLSQPKNPKGLFTQFGLSGKKLFTNGISNRAQVNYDYEDAAKTVMNAAPYPASYFPLKYQFNIRKFPLGSLRNGYFGLKIGGGTGLFYKKAEFGAAPTVFQPGAHFAANGITYPGDYNIAGLPLSYESPAGEDGDRFVLTYYDKVNKKLILEALKPDGSPGAISAAEVAVDPAPILGAPFAPAAMFEDVAVAGINFGTPEWRLYAWHVDNGAHKLDFMGDTVTPANAHFANGTTGVAYSIHALGKTGDTYSVLVLEMGAGGTKVVRVNFTHNGTKVTSMNSHDVAIPKVTTLVVGGGKAFAINNTGDVIPLDVSGDGVAAGSPLGKITEDAAQKVYLPFCGLNGSDIYCSGLFTKKSYLAAYKFATESKTQTTFKYNRPLLLSFTGSKLFVSYSIDGAGIEAFDVTKPEPKVDVAGGAGGTITTDSGATDGGASKGGVPAGGQMGGGGCSLSVPSGATPTAALLVAACLIGGSLVARLRRRARRG